jgi:AcrR family transcriptional regulator
MGIKERRQREKDLRRQQILEAAKELLMLKGFKFSTMEEIANRAELNPATIYNYFASKDHLHASLALMSLQDLVQKVMKIYENKNLSVENKICSFKDEIYKTYQADPRLFRNILQFQLSTDFNNLDNELLGQFNEQYRTLMNMFADVYEEGVRLGEFEEGPKMAYADIIFGTFVGLLLWEDAKNRVNPKKDFFRSTLDKAFDAFVEGIKKK